MNMLNALSVDVEEYYHVSAFESIIKPEDWRRFESRVDWNTNRILEFLDEFQTRGTFFVLGCVAEKEAKLVRRIHERGHEVASHGYSHRRIYTQEPSQFREETRRSKRILEDIIGAPVIGYRAASYSITNESLWAVDVLAEEGFQYDSSIFPIRHDLYGIPNHERFFHSLRTEQGRMIAELPLSTVRFGGLNLPVAGGGYLRLYPYIFTHHAIRFLNEKEGQPAVVYFHPWEIDPDQPRIRASWRSQFRHYTNLDLMEGKIRRLLSSFPFGPMKAVYQNCVNRAKHE